MSQEDSWLYSLLYQAAQLNPKASFFFWGGVWNGIKNGIWMGPKAHHQLTPSKWDGDQKSQLCCENCYFIISKAYSAKSFKTRELKKKRSGLKGMGTILVNLRAAGSGGQDCPLEVKDCRCTHNTRRYFQVEWISRNSTPRSTGPWIYFCWSLSLFFLCNGIIQFSISLLGLCMEA